MPIILLTCHGRSSVGEDRDPKRHREVPEPLPAAGSHTSSSVPREEVS